MRTPVETGRLHFSELPDASSRGRCRDMERRRRFPFGSSAISHLNNPHSAANRTYPRATARPQPQMASRPDDRSNGERTCSVPNDRTTALAHQRVVRRSLAAAIHQPFDPGTPIRSPAFIERRDARKGVHLPLLARRTGADRSMRSRFQGQCVTGRRSPVLRPIRQQSN
jgi:hypothetical protein